MAPVISTSIKVRDDINTTPARTNGASALSVENSADRQALVARISKIAGGETAVWHEEAAGASVGSNR
jgi:hypothetical protein